MNIKRLCLIAGLLSLPVAYANAADITINVPVELTDVPAANTVVVVRCVATLGAGSAARPLSEGISAITIPPSKNYSGTKVIVIRNVEEPTFVRGAGLSLNYKCELLASPEQPALT